MKILITILSLILLQDIITLSTEDEDEDPDDLKELNGLVGAKDSDSIATDMKCVSISVTVRVTVRVTVCACVTVCVCVLRCVCVCMHVYDCVNV